MNSKMEVDYKTHYIMAFNANVTLKQCNSVAFRRYYYMLN